MYLIVENNRFIFFRTLIRFFKDSHFHPGPIIDILYRYVVFKNNFLARYRWKATRARARSTDSWPRSSSLGGRYHRNRARLSTSPDCWRASHMHDTCSDENDRLRLVCKKSDTVTEPAGTTPPPTPPPPTPPPPPPPPLLQPATLDAELSLSTSIQLPGDRLTLTAPPITSLGDMYDMVVYARRTGMVCGRILLLLDIRIYVMANKGPGMENVCFF